MRMPGSRGIKGSLWSQCFDGRSEGGCGLLQGQGGRSLLGKIGDMDESDPNRCAGVVVQEGVEGIVADEGAGGVGNLTGEACVPDGLRHG